MKNTPAEEIAAQIADIELMANCIADNLAALKQKQKQAEEPKTWLRVGDKYWCLDGAGCRCPDRWNGSGLDRMRQAMGNIFRTEEEAKHELETRKVIAELRAQPGRRAFVVDVANFCMDYSTLEEKVLLSRNFNWDVGWQQINFDTAEHRDAAILAVGEDRILAAMKWMGEKP